MAYMNVYDQSAPRAVSKRIQSLALEGMYRLQKRDEVPHGGHPD